MEIVMYDHIIEFREQANQRRKETKLASADKIMKFVSKFGIETTPTKTQNIVHAITKEGKKISFSLLLNKHRIFKFRIRISYNGINWKSVNPIEFLSLFGISPENSLLTSFQENKENIKHSLCLLEKYRSQNYRYTFYNAVCFVNLDNGYNIYLSIDPQCLEGKYYYTTTFENQTKVYFYGEKELIKLLTSKLES